MNGFLLTFYLVAGTFTMITVMFYCKPGQPDGRLLWWLMLIWSVLA